ncbi:hypothetical protein NC661_19745 [Aquibacillus koreensis]|uniref:Uncharacterized protein n=1 Tax=Aquibacillus koreensis TaxID=279446 RepID=A0A9X4AK15_9BACI|nr:hypothetical protein [Aquibacillus koreensis]MCT2534199.1 hypothetical protein [Aquibacillus koreensis]MDC3422591.1 hypothetical protein [Aquibacillus koreensis]
MKNEQRTTNQKLGNFPTHQLNQKQKEDIHENIMDALKKNEVQLGRRGIFMKKVVATIATVAALILFTILGVNTFYDDENNTAGTGNTDQPSEQDLENDTNQEQNQSPEQDQSSDQDQDQEQNNKTEPDENPSSDNEEQENDIPMFTDEVAIELMQNYKQNFEVVLEAGNNNNLNTMFESKSDVQRHFEEIMSEERASSLVEIYIDERDGSLHIVPTEAPVWLDQEADFTIEQVNEENYKIIQTQHNELIGSKEMIYHAKWQDNQWILSDVKSNDLE